MRCPLWSVYLIAFCSDVRSTCTHIIFSAKVNAFLFCLSACELWPAANLMLWLAAPPGLAACWLILLAAPPNSGIPWSSSLGDCLCWGLAAGWHLSASSFFCFFLLSNCSISLFLLSVCNLLWVAASFLASLMNPLSPIAAPGFGCFPWSFIGLLPFGSASFSFSSSFSPFLTSSLSSGVERLSSSCIISSCCFSRSSIFLFWSAISCSWAMSLASICSSLWMALAFFLWMAALRKLSKWLSSICSLWVMWLSNSSYLAMDPMAKWWEALSEILNFLFISSITLVRSSSMIVDCTASLYASLMNLAAMAMVILFSSSSQ